MASAWIGLGANKRPYEPEPLPEGACRLCFGRGWFLAPNANGSSTPMECDKCKPEHSHTDGMEGRKP